MKTPSGVIQRTIEYKIQNDFWWPYDQIFIYLVILNWYHMIFLVYIVLNRTLDKGEWEES